MAFIPDKDLVKLYEDWPDVFGKASRLSEEDLLNEYWLLKRAVAVLENWTKKNYNNAVTL